MRLLFHLHDQFSLCSFACPTYHLLFLAPRSYKTLSLSSSSLPTFPLLFYTSLSTFTLYFLPRSYLSTFVYNIILAMDETATSIGEVDVAISPAVSTSSNVVARVTKGHVSWWELPAPRLQTLDSEEHISSMISTNFGLGWICQYICPQPEWLWTD